MKNRKEELSKRIEKFMEERINKKAIDEELIFEGCDCEDCNCCNEEKELEEMKENETLEEVEERISERIDEFMKENETLEEVEERIKEVAKKIESMEEGISIPVLVNGNIERSLTDKVNCNIVPVPILDLAIISNIGLEITDVWIKKEMESLLELEIDVLVPTKESDCLYKFTLGELYQVGLVTIVGSIKEEIELTPVEFRGLTVPVDLNELHSLI